MKSPLKKHRKWQRQWQEWIRWKHACRVNPLLWAVWVQRAEEAREPLFFQRGVRKRFGTRCRREE